MFPSLRLAPGTSDDSWAPKEGTEKRSETLFLVFPLPTSHQLSVQSFPMDLQDESERMEDLANLVVMGITVVIIAGVVIGVVAGIAEPTGNPGSG
ncbi:hypothetical protein NL676_032153 [Syzygium grande]|nr:hypothetical protein NL676_032153 [Syzygium grande]